MPRSYRALLAAGVTPLLLTLTWAPPANAADVTAAQATGLENQVRDTLGGLLGPAIKLSGRPVQVTPAGDHFDVAVPIGLSATPDARVTAAAKPGDNGVWLIEGVKVTSPLRFTVNTPVPGPDGTPKPLVPVTYTAEQTGQDGRIVWDPSFATASTWTSSSTATKIHADGGAQGGALSNDTTIGPVKGVTTLRPVADGRVDVLMDGTMQDYRVKSADPATPMEAAIQRIRVNGTLAGLSRAKATTLVQSVTAVLMDAARATPPGAPPGNGAHVAPEMALAMLDALQDLASSLTLEESGDGVIVNTQGQTVAMDHLVLGLDAKSDAGILQAGMTMGLEGLALPDFPMGEMAALLPKKVTLHPMVGGIDMAALKQIAILASEKKDPNPESIAALFGKGGITAGLDSLLVEMGGAVFKGQGQVVVAGPSPDQVTGTAQVTAQNFDALLKAVSAIPPLAQGVPALVFIKGIGHASGDTLVWDVTYKGNKVLVNDIDLTAMAGGGAPAAPPRRATPPAPVSPAPALPAPQAGGPRRPVPSWAK